MPEKVKISGSFWIINWKVVKFFEILELNFLLGSLCQTQRGNKCRFRHSKDIIEYNASLALFVVKIENNWKIVSPIISELTLHPFSDGSFEYDSQSNQVPLEIDRIPCGRKLLEDTKPSINKPEYVKWTIGEGVFFGKLNLNELVQEN